MIYNKKNVIYIIFIVNLMLSKSSLIYVLLDLIDYVEMKYLQSFIIIFAVLIFFLLLVKTI